jgi:hypothetical protein
MDDAAILYLRAEYNTPNRRMLSQDTPWMISINEKKQVRKLKDQVYSHVHLLELKAYWIKKERFAEETFKLQVDWDAATSAMKTSRLPNATMLLSIVPQAGVPWARWRSDCI